MSTLRDFVPEQVSVSWGGLDIDGYASDTFITAKRNTANTVNTVGADGSVGITLSADKTGTIEVTLMQTSDTHLILSAVQKAQDESKQLIRANFSVTDPSGGYLCLAKNAHIMETPDIALGSDQNEKTWVFFVENLSFTDSNPAVGANAALAARIADAVDTVKGISKAVSDSLSV